MSAFPPAENHWLDVATYLNTRPSSARVCGRLKDHGQAIFSGGETLPLAVRAPFKDGDLIAIDLPENKFTLLVATRGEHRPRSGFSIARSIEWAKFITAVREFFVARDFTEALTPTLVSSPGTEPFLDPFTTEWQLGSQSERKYLPTSPEFHLKKMLALGWTRVFEVKTCFRNGEISAHHQPEFQMLEWYRAYRNLDAIADDVAGLIAHTSQALGAQAPPLVATTMSELFARLGFQLTPQTTRDELTRLALAQKIAIDSSDTWDEVFFRIFIEKIEPTLGHDGPLLVRGYPPSQAALARIGTDGFADRFEVYWRGLELANAFHELNDPDENEKRFHADLARKKELGKEPVALDLELIEALRYGLPPSGGIALGLERLFMAILEIGEIAETRAFPILRRR